MSSQPLEVKLVNGCLVLSIGIDTLAWSVENDPERGYSKAKIRVSNNRGFADEVMSELLDEDEIGQTMASDLIDKAVEQAVNNGSIHAEIVAEAP